MDELTDSSGRLTPSGYKRDIPAKEIMEIINSGAHIERIMLSLEQIQHHYTSEAIERDKMLYNYAGKFFGDERLEDPPLIFKDEVFIIIKNLLTIAKGNKCGWDASDEKVDPDPIAAAHLSSILNEYATRYPQYITQAYKVDSDG